MCAMLSRSAAKNDSGGRHQTWKEQTDCVFPQSTDVVHIAVVVFPPVHALGHYIITVQIIPPQ